MLSRVISLVLSVFLICGCSSQSDVVEGDEKVGPFRELNLVDLEGNLVTVAAKPGQVMFVSFWGTWCSSCRKELSLISSLYKHYSPLSVYFASIAVDSKEDVSSFIRKRAVAYPVYVSDISVVQFLLKYGNKEGVLPFALLIHGGKRRSFVGELDAEVVRRFIDDSLCRIV